jgi:hypothetical protein
MNSDSKNQLTPKERELLKEAELQGGGNMCVDGCTMERLLSELASLRFLRELTLDEQEGGYD